jgi:hypothetical protein
MTTRESKTPPRVATVTARAKDVEVSGTDRAPIVIPATADKKHPERLAAALRGFLADAFVAGYDRANADMAMMDGNDE